MRCCFGGMDLQLRHSRRRDGGILDDSNACRNCLQLSTSITRPYPPKCSHPPRCPSQAWWLSDASPSRRPVGPVMLESCRRGLSGPRLGWPMPPNGAGPASQRPSLASRRWSRWFQVRARLTFRVTASFSRLRSVGLPSGRLVTARSAGPRPHRPLSGLHSPLAKQCRVSSAH